MHMQVMFDIGGTQTRMGYSSRGETIEGIRKWPTPPDFEAGIKQINSELEKVAKPGEIRAVAVGIAGVLDINKQKLVRSPNLTNWVGQPLAENIKKITGAKVSLENDAALAALGEAVYGAGKKYHLVGYITVGTGIGGARIVNGKIDHRTIGFEPGQQLIGMDDLAGVWEQLASGTALAKKYGKKAEEIDDPHVWELETKLLATGLVNVLVMWSPEILILGGGIMEKIDLAVLKKHTKEKMQIFLDIPPIVGSELGETAGLMGGLRLIWEEGKN